MARECGECQACCTVMSVVEIGKPERTPCTHLADRGCGIYATRPYSCLGFQCLWIADLVDDDETESHKPSNSGLMFTVTPSEGEFVKNCFEVQEGAFTRNQEWLAFIAKQEVFILRPFDGSPFKLIGKPAMIQEFVAKHIEVAQ